MREAWVHVQFIARGIRVEYSLQGLIESEWSTTENNRRARFYKLTRKGRLAAQAELDSWLRLSKAITQVLRAIEQEG